MIDLDQVKKDMESLLADVSQDLGKQRSIMIVTVDHNGEPRSGFAGQPSDMAVASSVLQGEFLCWYNHGDE